jgi:hypothetical protein
MRFRVWIGSTGLHHASVLAIWIVMSCALNAQTAPRADTLKSPKPSVDVKNVTLGATTFRTNVGPVTVACQDSFCENLGVFLTPSAIPFICPRPAGATCTYYIHLETQASVSANDTGVFQFLVDGIAPNPGPTDFRGFFEWDTADPNSTVSQARSYSVTARVTNSKDNQGHSVEAEFGCLDLTGDGCSSTMGMANMSIAVYTP